MLKLHELTPAGKKKKRVGRGGSRGGTSGKGHKGQRSRSGGKARPGFEGGQMPLYRRLPKRGFSNARFKKESAIINIDALDKLFEDGQTVNKATLVEKGVLKKSQQILLKILGNGSLVKKIIVEADACSKSATDAIEKAGGQVRLIKES